MGAPLSIFTHRCWLVYFLQIKYPTERTVLVLFVKSNICFLRNNNNRVGKVVLVSASARLQEPFVFAIKFAINKTVMSIDYYSFIDHECGSLRSQER